ncbi:MAG TPA: sigma-70 family RNA polymerase sigma factor [Polyangiaceae bacterium]|jgi:RNA polymerase sigma factor (sigma-70 family)
MVMLAGLEPKDRGARLADPGLRRDIEAAVKRRVRGHDADDVVQAALADVLSAARVPEDAEEFRRFVFAVTRNKVFDHFRRRVREAPEDEALEPAASDTPLSARDMLRWAEAKLPDAEAQHTLEWMLREGDGEKLEQIARDANLPAPRVRQRVSRLRRFLREHWAAELMLGTLGVALLATGAAFYYRYLRSDEIAHRDPVLLPEPPKSREMQGRELRRAALLRCEKSEAAECLAGLDRARALDPAGDRAAEVVNARSAAAARMAPVPSATPVVPPSASPVLKPAPSASAFPHRTSMPAPASTESSLDSDATPRPHKPGK